MTELLHSLTRLPLAEGKGRARLLLIVNGLLLVFIAYALAQLTWRLLPAPEAPPVVAAPVNPLPVVPENAGTNIQALAALHLFGEAKDEAPAPVVPETAPDTSLNLTLRGVLAAEEDTADSARAIIAGPDGIENAYAVGDTLPGNATLKQIYTDRVILQHSGRFETLRLPKDEAPGAAPVAARGVQPLPGGGESLRNMRQRLISNPAGLLDMVNIAPVPQAGGAGLQGYRIMPGRDRRMLHQLGLRPGDVVTSVNGIALNDPAQGNQALQSLSQGESINLTVLRNGVEQQLTLSMDQTVGP